MEAGLLSLWEALESSLIAPGLRGADLLNPGAGQAGIRAFEAAVGVSLPQAVFDSYLRHDGMPAEKGYYCFWDGNFLSLQQSLAERQSRIQAATIYESPAPDIVGQSGAIQPVAWHPLWIPVLKKNKEPVCLDFAPGPAGQAGQVIEVDAEGCEIKLLAPSYLVFLQKLVARLQA